MNIILTLLYTVFYLLGGYLILNCFYLLFFAIAGHFIRRRAKHSVAVYRRICILIPAYKENAVVLESSIHAINHQYSGKFKVVVIADGLEEETITKMRSAGVDVIPVYFEKSTKGKSLLFAMNEMKSDDYEVALILDIDNLMGDNCLNEINAEFDKGAIVVQTHRTAKNLSSPFAFLDSCNEEINNHIYRKGHFAVGLSPALIGSGMAFEYKYLHSLLRDIGETVGEDKEMDFKIARDKNRIIYLNDTLVYDEKIENSEVFTQQRTRWIAAQIEFVKKYFLQGFMELWKNHNYEFFNKVLQSILVPRMLLLGLLFILSLPSPFLYPHWSSLFFPVLFIVLCFTLLISLPGKLFRDKRLFAALIKIPYALVCMVVALFNIKRAKESFLPTPHSSTSSKQKSNINL